MNIPKFLLSMLMPLIILSGLYWFLNQSDDTNIFEYHPDVTAIDRRLDATQPEILLVGSSLANKSVDEQSLAKQLGLAEDKVQKLWSGMATIPAVTLMIENRILNRNLQPKSIIILSPPNWLITNEILQNANFAMHQTQSLSQTLATVLGQEFQSSPSTIQQRKIQFQDGYTALNQQIFGEVLLNRSSEEIDEQLEMVFDFDQQRTDVNKGPQLIQHNVREINGSQAPTNTNSTDLRLLEYLAKRVHDAGIHLVVVTLPVSNVIKEEHRVSGDILEQMIQTLDIHDAKLLDYFEWSEPNMYADTKHMNKRGRELFTAKLVPDLQQMGILSDTLQDAAPPPSLSAPTLTWSNQAPTLLPDDTLTLTFPIDLNNTILRICASGTEPTTLISVPNTTFSRQGSRNIWCDSGSLSTIAKNQTIVLTNTSTNPITIHSIEMNDVELINQPRHILSKREWRLDQSTPITAHAIRENSNLGKWLQKKQTQHPDLQVGTLSKYKGLTDVPLLKNGISNECRPLTVQLGSADLSLSACKEVWANNQGSCLHKDALLNISKKKIDWARSTVSLQSERGCQFTHPRTGFGWWVYPGDVASTHFNWPKGDYTKVYLEGQSIGQGPWSMKVYADDVIYVDFSSTDPLNLALEIPLDDVLPANTPNIRVSIEVPKTSNHFLFVHKVQIQN